jgi:hypothetical protein
MDHAYDELCLLSGIRPGGGPRNLLSQNDLDRIVTEMTEEIKTISKSVPSDLDSILRESLALAAHQDVNHYNEENTWKPPGLTQWPSFDICIAIGYFDESGCCEALYHGEDGNPRAPGGHDVELRRVYTDQGSVWFDYVITGDTGYEKKERIRSNCTVDSNNPNFFVLEGCYRYLEAWLDWDSLPPRCVAFPDDAEAMSIPSEFYEIVNSREDPRGKHQNTSLFKGYSDN